MTLQSSPRSHSKREDKKADAEGTGRKRSHQRRPSDYERILVRNMGFIPTEESRPLCPSHSLSNIKSAGVSDDIRAAALKLGVRVAEINPPEPPSARNDYDTIVVNPGFQINSKEDSPPRDWALTSSPAVTSGNGMEVIKNQSYGEVPTARSRSRSIPQNASNPMYGVISTSSDCKETVQSSVYEPPPERPIANWQRAGSFSKKEVLSTYQAPLPSNSHHHSGADTSSPKFSHLNYDVPPNKPLEVACTGERSNHVPKSSQGRPLPQEPTSNSTDYNGTLSSKSELKGSIAVKNSGAAVATYSVPSSDKGTCGRERVTGTQNPKYATYDIPTNKSTDATGNKPRPPLYDVPSNNSLSTQETNGVNSNSTSSKYPHGSHVLYNIPPRKSQQKDDALSASRTARRAHATHVLYDIPHLTFPDAGKS